MPLLDINLLPVNIPQNSCPKCHLLDGVCHYYGKLSHKELRHMLYLFVALREKCITNSFQPCDYTSSRPILQIGPEQTPQSRSPALHPCRSDETSSQAILHIGSDQTPQSRSPALHPSRSDETSSRSILHIGPDQTNQSRSPALHRRLQSMTSFPLRRNIVAVNPRLWTRPNVSVALTSASSRLTASINHEIFPAL